MNTLVSILNFVSNNYQTIISNIVIVLSGLISICLLIPGDQPEKFLQKAVDFLSKFSKKPEPKQ